jgi:hypothetical protein
VRRLVVVVLAAGSVLAFGVSSAGATRECDGLQVCVRVAGPWVVVPAGGVEFQLSCPARHIVGGLDAELSRRAIDVRFEGRLGAPVNPGVTTRRAALFVAAYVGGARSAPTFRPHLGCMPAAGGGARVPTALHAFPPGEPAVRRVRNVRVRAGARRVVISCQAGERVVASSHAVGFLTKAPPSASVISKVRASRSVSGRRVVASVVAAPLGSVRAVVQVTALCAGGA